MIPQEEMKDVFEQFLNHAGVWHSFKDFIESQGYSLSDFGMEED